MSVNTILNFNLRNKKKSSDTKMAAMQCIYFKFGFCKYGDRCRKIHVKEKCEESNCIVENCSRRHQKPCKYFMMFQNCKFGEYCEFLHTKSITAFEIESLTKRVQLLEENLLTNEEKIEISEIQRKVEHLEKENKEDKKNVAAAVKDLEARQSQLEVETYARCGDVEVKVRAIIDSLKETENIQSNACHLCRRTFGNNRSLENHIRNHHQSNIT